MPSASPKRLCATVISEPAPIYAAADVNSTFIKNKADGDPVTVLDRPSDSLPEGWLAVWLPRDKVAVGWMLRQDLSTPVPGPCPPPKSN